MSRRGDDGLSLQRLPARSCWVKLLGLSGFSDGEEDCGESVGGGGDASQQADLTQDVGGGPWRLLVGRRMEKGGR